jgi:hypothetical protein
VAMDRTHLWGRRLLSAGFLALAVLGVRSVGTGTGSVEGLVGGGLVDDDRGHCRVRDLGVAYEVERDPTSGATDAVGGAEFGVAGARLSGPPLCAGTALSVTFGGADGSPLARATGRFDPDAPTLPLDGGGTIAADDVASIAVVLFD